MNTTPDSTQILKWKNGKRAVFLLEFDDSAPSAVHTAIPELVRRRLPGTFYINPGNEPYQTCRAEWERASQLPGIEFANHTQTHVGSFGKAQLDTELAQCNEVIRQSRPDRPWPRLISFGRPGGVPWNIPLEDQATLFAQHHLIERPPFLGYPFQLHAEAEVLALVDTALACGEMGHHDFHGVGGDWHVTPLETFIALLDKLEAHRDELWITDPISWHQYTAERNSATTQQIRTTPDTIELRLTCATDPAFYNLPLTLCTAVPSEWNAVIVTQGATKSTVPVRQNRAIYAARPGDKSITLQPVS